MSRKPSRSGVELPELLSRFIAGLQKERIG